VDKLWIFTVDKFIVNC